MSPKYTLYYFNLTALGEPIRFLLNYRNIPFDDIRYDRSGTEWPEKIKATTPLGQLPVLDIDGKRVYQHLAICRYLGKLVGLAGENDWEALEIDIVADTLSDLRSKLAPVFRESDPELKEKLFAKISEETIPFYLTKLNEIVGENGYLANGKLSWVDLYFAALVPMFNMFTRMNVTENYSNLKKVQDNVHNLPAIKKWLEIRPKSVF